MQYYSTWWEGSETGWHSMPLILCIIDILMHGREITYSYQVEKKRNSVALVGLQADSILT